MKLARAHNRATVPLSGYRWCAHYDRYASWAVFKIWSFVSRWSGVPRGVNIPKAEWIFVNYAVYTILLWISSGSSWKRKSVQFSRKKQSHSVDKCILMYFVRNHLDPVCNWPRKVGTETLCSYLTSRGYIFVVWNGERKVASADNRLACISSASARVRRESWDESTKTGMRGEGEGSEGNAWTQTPRFWKTAFAHERSFWLVRCW